jgi:hypothetical protein
LQLAFIPSAFGPLGFFSSWQVIACSSSCGFPPITASQRWSIFSMRPAHSLVAARRDARMANEIETRLCFQSDLWSQEISGVCAIASIEDAEEQR